MRYTENINLPIVEDNDLYSKEINNLAFEEIDRVIKGLNYAIENNNRVIQDLINRVETLEKR